MRVYIAGPYTKGDIALNIRHAIEAGDEVLKLGHTPYIPHLNHFWHLVCPGAYKQWLALDLKWLETCHALIRLPGESVGADKEVVFALEHGMIVNTLEEFREWVQQRK